MGQKPSSSSGGVPQELEYYVIRLQPEQSIHLYGYMCAKTTLTWRDVMLHTTISMRKCVECGIHAEKLCRMQPDIREWLKIGKAKIDDCALMGPWKPNVFTDLGCNIGELVIHRQALTAKIVIDGGGTFTMLKDVYGLTPELMALLKYTSKDWIDLGVHHTYLKELTDDQWIRIFGTTHNRCEMLEMTKRNENNILQQP